MRITVNGQPQDLPDDATVADLVERLRLAAAACAVEVNRAITPKARRATTRLLDGDVVEIVTLVGGG